MTCVPNNFTTEFPMNVIYFTCSIIPAHIEVIANGSIIFVICRGRQLQTSTNVLLAGLAANDILGAIFGLIVYASILSFGQLLANCTVYNFLIGFMFVQYMAAQIIVMFITHVRYKIFLGGLQRTHQANDGVTRVIAMLVLAWIIGGLCVVPVFVPSLFLYRYVPVLLLTISSMTYIGYRYITITRRLKRREKEYRVSESSDRQLALRFIKTQKQCLRTIVIILVILLSPLVVGVGAMFFTYYMEKSGRKTLRTHYYAWCWVIWFYLIGGCINPFIYAARQKDLGKSILDLLRSCGCGTVCSRLRFGCCQARVSHGDV